MRYRFQLYLEIENCKNIVGNINSLFLDQRNYETYTHIQTAAVFGRFENQTLCYEHLSDHKTLKIKYVLASIWKERYSAKRNIILMLNIKEYSRKQKIALFDKREITHTSQKEVKLKGPNMLPCGIPFPDGKKSLFNYIQTLQ